MKEFDIKQFSPKKAELFALAKKYKSLEIKDVEDKEGYELVDLARKDLGKMRIQIVKDGKLVRKDFLDFQRAVIARVKELVKIIEPIELELKQKQQVISEEKAKIVRMKLLPERLEKLQTINVVVDEDSLLSMDEHKFSMFFNEKKSQYLEEKEIKQKAKEEELEDEKRKIEEAILAIENEKQHQKELKEARIEATKQAKIDAELNAKREKENAERKVKEAKEEEKAEQEKLEKRKKYQAFLIKNKYKKGDGNFLLQNWDDRVILFKKVDEFIF